MEHRGLTPPTGKDRVSIDPLHLVEEIKIHLAGPLTQRLMRSLRPLEAGALAKNPGTGTQEQKGGRGKGESGHQALRPWMEVLPQIPQRLVTRPTGWTVQQVFDQG